MGSQPPLEGLQIQMVGSWKCQAEGLGLHPECSREPSKGLCNVGGRLPFRSLSGCRTNGGSGGSDQGGDSEESGRIGI